METKFWLKMIAKIVVILLLPLSMGFEIDDFGSSLYYASVIINIGTYPRWFIPEIPTPGMQPSLNLNLLAIVAALLLCVPGIYFSHWLSRQPREKSIKKQLFAAVVFVPMMLFPVSFLFPSPMIGPSFYPYEYSLSFLPTWILIVLVLLSVFTREGAFIDAARQRQALKSVSDAQVASLPGLLGRGMAMAVTVGMVALFVPFFMLIFGWSAGEQSVMFASTSWFGSFRSWTNYAYFEMTPVPFASVYGLTSLLIPIPFVFNLVFGHTVLLYLQSRASKMRTALYGILGVVVPYSMLSFPYLMTGEVTGFIPTFIPLPVLQAVGVLMMVFVDSTLQDERIWDDVDDRMWFDEGGRDEERTPDTTPEVTIPVTYLLKSRIRNLWNGSNSRTVTTDPKKAEWAHDEEVWT